MTGEEEDVGTVRWFGESWDAPVNDPRAQVETPFTHCYACSRPIIAGQQGIGVPDGVTGGYSWWHKACWMGSVVGGALGMRSDNAST